MDFRRDVSRVFAPKSGGEFNRQASMAQLFRSTMKHSTGNCWRRPRRDCKFEAGASTSVPGMAYQA